MKHTNAALCHVFARNTGENDENQNGTMFIENNTIYSYGRHYAMAHHIDGVVLMNIDTYSTTTAKQMSYLRSAINHRTVYYVENVVPSNKKDHVANYLGMVQRFNDTLTSAARARQNKDWLLNGAVGLANQANAYADLFKLRNKRIDTSSIDLDAIKEAAKKKVEADKKKAAKAECAKVKAAAQQIIDWQNCEPNIRAPYIATTLLRIKGDNIETSKSASIPLSFAPMVWEMVNACIDSGTPYFPKDDIKFGHYSLKAIDNKGNIQVDCHLIKFEELARLAKILGF